MSSFIAYLQHHFGTEPNRRQSAYRCNQGNRYCNPHGKLKSSTIKTDNMEIVSIERKTFEELVAKFDRFVSRMDGICRRHGEKKMNEWMDNQDVCRMLDISTRTLQTLRDNGTLGYSQINHKIYYRPEDVQRIMSVVESKRKKKNAIPSGRHTE
jgi:hypothetical protein